MTINPGTMRDYDTTISDNGSAEGSMKERGGGGGGRVVAGARREHAITFRACLCTVGALARACRAFAYVEHGIGHCLLFDCFIAAGSWSGADTSNRGLHPCRPVYQD